MHGITLSHGKPNYRLLMCHFEFAFGFIQIKNMYVLQGNNIDKLQIVKSKNHSYQTIPCISTLVIPTCTYNSNPIPSSWGQFHTITLDVLQCRLWFFFS